MSASPNWPASPILAITAASAVAGMSLALIFSIAAKTATFGRAKPSRWATQIALRIISTLRATSGVMFTAGSVMNISRFSCGDSNTVMLLSRPPWPEPVVAVENRPQDHARVNVPLHEDVGVALAAHGHGLDRGLLRIGLVDDLDAGRAAIFSDRQSRVTRLRSPIKMGLTRPC